MQLQLIRNVFTDNSTIGKLSVNDVFECFTLEDKVRPVKIKGETAIPAGTYEVAVTFSNKFQKFLPLLLSVPNFDGIRIHPGNFPKDTLGCILVGQGKGVDMVSNSRLAFAQLFEKIQAVVRTEKVFIEITEER
ncbi:MAG TPA: DUF5675 family protein [Blastocatellia bacterium]|nr:DUF5675 family protein [Blastocatellia bacterium]